MTLVQEETKAAQEKWDHQDQWVCRDLRGLQENGDAMDEMGQGDRSDQSETRAKRDIQVFQANQVLREKGVTQG